MKWIALGSLAFLAGGCGSMMAYAYQPSEDKVQGQRLPEARSQSDLPAAPPHDETLAAAAFEARQIIYTGRFAIAVGDVDRAQQETRRLAEQMGGYMDRLSTRAITIRVPSARFHEAVEAITKLGITYEREVEAQDVTEQLTDLEMRLKNAQALAERYRDMLKNARTVEETLAVQKRLSDATLEYEQLAGRLKALSHRVAFATISVAFDATAQAPSHIKTRLPFAWLNTLGIGNLLYFRN